MNTYNNTHLHSQPQIIPNNPFIHSPLSAITRYPIEYTKRSGVRICNGSIARMFFIENHLARYLILFTSYKELSGYRSKVLVVVIAYPKPLTGSEILKGKDPPPIEPFILILNSQTAIIFLIRCGLPHERHLKE